MRQLNQLLLLLLMIFAFSGSVFAQETDPAMEDDGDYCSLFYLKSNDQDILPFDNACFTHVTYHVADYQVLNYVGPIEEASDLFRAAPYGINIRFPEISEPTKLSVSSPVEVGSMETTPADNQAHLFITLYDHEASANHYENKVDFRAVSGFIKIIDVNPNPGKRKFEFQAFASVYVQKVENGELTGPRVNLRFSMVGWEDFPKAINE